jgi:ABC-type nitrate/sulfonate/bicarbonate transport system ATPase subunit
MQIILLITHDISEALLLSDEVLVLTSHQISSFDTSQILNPTDLSSNNIWEQVQMTLLGDYYSTRL